jgi:hypothetical protein
MEPESSFEVMPQRYPVRTKHKKGRLFPFVERVLYDLTMFAGHESPKHITIMVSNIWLIAYPSPSGTCGALMEFCVSPQIFRLSRSFGSLRQTRQSPKHGLAT